MFCLSYKQAQMHAHTQTQANTWLPTAQGERAINGQSKSTQKFLEKPSNKKKNYMHQQEWQFSNFNALFLKNRQRDQFFSLFHSCASVWYNRKTKVILGCHNKKMKLRSVPLRFIFRHLQVHHSAHSLRQTALQPGPSTFHANGLRAHI